MSLRKCPACQADLPDRLDTCPQCGLTGLNQVFLTKKERNAWFNNIILYHKNTATNICLNGKEDVIPVTDIDLHKENNQDGFSIHLDKIDLPGTLITLSSDYRAAICKCNNGDSAIVNLETGETIKMPSTYLENDMPDRRLKMPHRTPLSILRYMGKIYSGLAIIYETYFIFITEGESFVFTDFIEVDAESELSEVNASALEKYRRYDYVIKKMTTFKCENTKGEEVHGFHFKQGRIKYPTDHPVDLLDKDNDEFSKQVTSYFIFSDAIIDGFFHEGLCLARDPKTCLNNQPLAGYIDFSGLWVIAPKYMIGRTFFRGISATQMGDEIVYLDYTGNKILAIDISDIEYRGRIKAVDKGGKYFLTDKQYVWGVDEQKISGVHTYDLGPYINYIRPPIDGKMVFGTPYRDITVSTFYGPRIQTDYHDLYGYIDFSKGCLDMDSVSTDYEKAKEYHNGVALVKKYSRWGLITQSGKIIVDFLRFEKLFLYDNGIVIGYEPGFLSSSKGKWYQATILPYNKEKPLVFKRIPDQKPLNPGNLLDSSESELSPPWIRFPDMGSSYLNSELFDTKTKEYYHYFADGYYTVLRNHKYDILNSAGKIISSGWKAIGDLGPSWIYGKASLIGKMEEDGWNLFYKDVLPVSDGKHFGLLRKDGKLVVSTDWSGFYLWQKIGIAFTYDPDPKVDMNYLQCLVFDYSWNTIHKFECEYFKYDGVADFLVFSSNNKLTILDIRNGKVTKTDYLGFYDNVNELSTPQQNAQQECQRKKRFYRKATIYDENKACGFSAIHNDMLAIFDKDGNATSFLTFKGQKLATMDDWSDILNKSDEIRAGWAGENGDWFIWTKDRIFKIIS